MRKFQVNVDYLLNTNDLIGRANSFRTVYNDIYERI